MQHQHFPDFWRGGSHDGAGYVLTIHPEAHVIFFVWKCEDLLMSYDMDRGKVCVICSLTEPMFDRFPPYFPYAPSFHGLADQD